MTAYNPTSGLLGLEWLVLRQVGARLVDSSNAIEQTIPVSNTADETIDKVLLYVAEVVDDPTITVEVFNRAALPQVATTSTFRPNEDVSTGTSGVTGSPTNTAGSLYTNYDEATLDTTDYLVNTNGSFIVNFRVASSGFSSSAEVLKLRIKGFARSTAANSVTGTVTVAVVLNSVVYTLGTLSINSADGVTAFQVESSTNPATGLAWTASEIQAFDATTHVRITVNTNQSSTSAYLYQAWMEVEGQTAPQARSIAVVPTEGWNAVDVDTPAASDTFTKRKKQTLTLSYSTGSTQLNSASSVFTSADVGSYVSGPGIPEGAYIVSLFSGFVVNINVLPTQTLNDQSVTVTPVYSIVVRRSSGNGAVTIPALEADAEHPSGFLAHAVTYSPSGLLDTFDTTDLTAVYPIGMITSTPGIDSDPQPYAALRLEEVYSGRTLQQEFTPGGAFTARWVEIVARRDGLLVDGDLLVKLKKRSDNSQVGGTATISADDLDEMPRVVRTIGAALASSASLSSATQYYVEVSSTATEGRGWQVAVLDAAAVDSTRSGTTAKGYGGTTDRGTIAGTESDDYDLPFILADAPTQPAAPTVTVVTV